jgi:hypothetical protein
MILTGAYAVATQIVRIGNTLAVAVSEELLAEMGFSAGDSVEWEVSESGKLSLVPSDSLLTGGNAIPSEIPGADDEASIRAQILAGFADLDAGRSVSHEKVVAWLESWGTENELPVPECD